MSGRREVVFDVEGDGLHPTKLHCMAWDDGSGVKSTTDYQVMRDVLLGADVLIGHNITLFDIPVCEDILGIKVEAELMDTLALSWYIRPEMLPAGLDAWAKNFGMEKPKIDDWGSLPIEEYLHRCEEDVRINKKVWRTVWCEILGLYQNNEVKALEVARYLNFKMHCVSLATKSKWRLDVEKAKAYAEELRVLRDELVEKLSSAMPLHYPKSAYKNKPSKPFKMDGSLSKAGEAWFSLLERHNLPKDFKGPLKVPEKGNPASSTQLKDWLFSLGWVPENFKYKREEDGFRAIPQIRIDADGQKVLCPSVDRLAKTVPEVELLRNFSVITHRLAILEGMLKSQRDGYVKADIRGFTNTLRLKHKEVVNLPGVNKEFGEYVRGVLIAPDGWELAGSDMASLEDRTKQHYMWDFDPEYVKEMNVEGFDPHLDIAVVAGMMTQEQADAYKAGDKSLHAIRHDAKQVNYSCTYGVSAEGLVRNNGMTLKQATTLRDAYWRRNWAIKSISDSCEVKTYKGRKWLRNPLNGFWYWLKNEKDRFSTLNQGTGSYCFDMWVKEILKVRPQITAQFHDEVVLCVPKGYREQVTRLLKKCIDKVNKELKMNRSLDIDVQFGDNYAEIH